MLRGPAHPPCLRPPHLLLPPCLWRDFWSLCLPSKAFTPWWRLIHGRVSAQASLDAINDIKFPSSYCRLCEEEPEDAYHLAVGSVMKSLFWSEVVSHLGLADRFPTDTVIWMGLTTLHDMDNNPLDISVLKLLGAAFSTLWQYHWADALNRHSWLSRNVLSCFLADHARLISSFLEDM